MSSTTERIRKTWASLPRRTQRMLRWLVVAVVCYTILGFIILPLVIRAVATKRLTQELNRPVTIKSVRLNPYAFSCAINGLSIKDPDGEPFVSWDRVYVNFELVSFFGTPWVFKDLTATNIYVRAQMNKDYSFNFSDLIEKFAKPGSAPAKPSKPLELEIEKLDVSGVRASVTDMTPRVPFKRIIGPLEITLKNFHTDPKSRNPHSFTGSTESGEVFSWSGSFYLNPIRAEGELSVKNISLNKYAPLYQDLVRFEIRDGIASFSGGYRFVSGATNNLVMITNCAAALRSFKLAEPGAADNLVDLPSFDVSGVSGDLVRRQVNAGSLSVTGAVLNVHRSHDASINVVEAAKPAATNAPGGIVVLLQAATNLFSMLLNSTNAGTATLHNLSVENCAVTLHDEINSRPVSLTLDQIHVAAKNLSNLPGTNLTAEVSLRWNTNGIFKTELTASTAPMSADVHLFLDQIELNPLDPYLEPYVYLFIIGSKVGLDGRVQLRTEAGQLPSVTFAGNYHLDDFATVDGAMAENLLKWKSLRLEGIEATLNPPSVSIAKLQLDDVFARVVVETNHSINLLTALHPQNTNQVSVAPIEPETPAARSAKKTLSQVKEVMSRTNGVAASGLPQISIAALVISNAQVDLTDRSLTPQVHAALHSVNGTITDISSDELRRAQVRIEGKVDNAGSIEITGQLNPLHQNAASQVKVVMKDINLNPTDPYMGKFLGYRLRKGKLSVDVNYEVTEKHLKGQNLIQLDQLTLGEKVASPDATKLPVKLGIAILKDRSGKIELDVPVEGNLDDPEFRLNKVIWHTLVNVFTKIVTSPFAALGSLFGGKGEEVGYQDFDPGMVELLPASVEKLAALTKALYERPGLEVEIEGNADPVVDREGLRHMKLEQQLRVRKWQTLRKSEQAAVAPQQITLTPEERARYLAEFYQKYLDRMQSEGKSPAPGGPATRQPGENADPMAKGAQALVRSLLTPAEHQQIMSATERQLLDSMSVADADLRNLAVDRAKAVQNYLVQTGKIEAERVYLMENAAGTNGHRVYLHLQ